LLSIFGFNTFGESNETSGTLAIPLDSIQGLSKCKVNALHSSLSDFLSLKVFVSYTGVW